MLDDRMLDPNDEVAASDPPDTGSGSGGEMALDAPEGLDSAAAASDPPDTGSGGGTL